MRKLLLLIAPLVFLFYSSVAQVLTPVKWTFTTKDLGNCEVELVMKATIDKGWHLYAQKPVEDGPIPTSFQFTANPGYEKVGPTQEGKPIVKFEKVFDAELSFFEHEAIFKQKVKLKSDKEVVIKGSLEFMVCDDGRCLPPETVEFEFKVKGSAACLGGGTTPNTNSNDPKNNTPENPKTPIDSAGQTAKTDSASVQPVAVSFLSFSKKEKGYDLQIILNIDSGWSIPAGKTFNIKFEVPNGVALAGGTDNTKESGAYSGKHTFTQTFNLTSNDSSALKNIQVLLNFEATKDGKVAVLKEEVRKKVDLSKSSTNGGQGPAESYWIIFFTAFFSGFLALLTPCVFPMIPMTVSFFLKTSKTKAKGIRNAITYGIFIVVIYVSLGLTISAIFGSDALNALSTNIYFNIFFFILLVVFAFSFLGAFEIVLPSSWTNAADKGSDKGGLVGIFFMATTLGLVSFSCTGPIIGTLLVQASQQGGMGPFFGMLGFSLAIALPFTIFAIFPGWLNTMPKSGGWLNSVKVSLGFLELALALKFLSNADLVVQAHLLEREIFLSLWIVIFALWGIYLLGKIKMSHDSDLPYLSVGRLSLAIVVFAFVSYMIPGLWGAPLKIIAAFPPPLYYSESPYGVGGEPPSDTLKLPEHAHFGPHKLITFHDYHHALDYAKESGKALMIDFTGYACVNCRLMEETVWSAPEVLSHLRKDFVIASLHVDDKTSLPENEKYESAFDGKKIRTIGNKWSDLQKSRYGSNSQPQYLILDHEENTLNGFASYETHGQVPKFLPWLEEGLKIFNDRKSSPEYRPAMAWK